MRHTLAQRFCANAKGAVALIVALTVFAVALAAGASVDLYRVLNARGTVQEVADAAALAAASSSARNEADLERVAQSYFDAHLEFSHVHGAVESDLAFIDERTIELSVSGEVETAFMQLAGVQSLPFSVTAQTVRGTPQEVEVALVLDNTWSMSDVDANGVRKIDALKTSARTLINEIMQDADDNVRVALVPYADYVNVGTANRGQSWLSVPADYSVTNTPAPRTCQTRTTRTTCNQSCTPRTCTRYVDGVAENYSCPNCGPQTCTTQTVPPYEVCSGGGNPTTTWHRWYGCVGSRKEGSHRLNDNPGKTYPGFLGTSQECLNPIRPLTTDRTALNNWVNGLIVNIGGYKPYTYIPAGMMWGINVLSPGAPFTEGAAYDEENRQPRKIIVLMTDGENTLRFDPGNTNGKNHPGFSGNATVQGNQRTASDNDTRALCEYAKSRNMEVFTVAFAVSNGPGKTMLQACATDSEHYFDAADGDSLQSAFSAIARSINTVRLSR